MPNEVAGSLSSLGQQVLSTKPTGPRARIGTAGRHEKFAEEPFELKHLGGTSHGVSTEPKSAFGQQIKSYNTNSPSYRFGNRYASDNDMVKEARPGPGSYQSPEALGKQITSANPTSPAWKVATGGRFSHFKPDFKSNFATPGAQDYRPSSGWLGDCPKYSFHGKARRMDIANGAPASKPSCNEDPGPGTYEPASSLGFQIDSRRPTSQKTRVGTADRDKQSKVFLGEEHARCNYGKHSPAPNAYSPRSHMTSTTPAQIGFKFGSGDRFSQVRTSTGKPKVNVPGPGSYVV